MGEGMRYAMIHLTQYATVTFHAWLHDRWDRSLPRSATFMATLHMCTLYIFVIVVYCSVAACDSVFDVHVVTAHRVKA